jgi:hypothetical protein
MLYFFDQSFPVGTAGLAQSNTPDRQETAYRLNSITKHQHTIIPYTKQTKSHN